MDNKKERRKKLEKKFWENRNFRKKFFEGLEVKDFYKKQGIPPRCWCVL